MGWEVMSDGGARCVFCIKCDVLEAGQAKDASSLFFFYLESYFHLSPLKTLSSTPLHPRCIFVTQIICMSESFQTAD